MEGAFERSLKRGSLIDADRATGTDLEFAVALGGIAAAVGYFGEAEAGADHGFHGGPAIPQRAMLKYAGKTTKGGHPPNRMGKLLF